MYFEQIHIENFRNHRSTSFHAGRGINVFVGENGEGKTNVLEAISFLCLTKSFFGNVDAHALTFGEKFFTVEGTARSQTGISYNIRVEYSGEEARKEVFINKAPVEKFSSVVGTFPLVVLSPESAAITFGPPAERRKFIDFVISQSSKVYLEDVLDYRRILRQRNKILIDAKIGKTDPRKLLEAWNAELIERGSRIVLRRKNFVEEFQPIILQAYQGLAGGAEVPGLCYEPSFDLSGVTSEKEVRICFEEELERRSIEERRSGSTIVGPHRDELKLLLNETSLNGFASQGQHKTFQIALKIGEFHYLRERCRETPVLLLDDVFSELDAHRAERLLNVLVTLGQAFITTTSDNWFPPNFDWSGPHRRFTVHQGSVFHEEASNIIS